MSNLIRCEHNNEAHKDCFARHENGTCECLRDCYFRDGKCHFYKERKKKKAGASYEKDMC